MDLSKVTQKGAFDVATDMTLLDPHGAKPLMGSDNKPILFQVHSASSAVARDVSADNAAKAVSDANPDGLTQTQQNLNVMSALIVGWSNNIEYEGKKLKYSKSNLDRLVSEQEWINTQVFMHASNGAKYRPKFETH